MPISSEAAYASLQAYKPRTAEQTMTQAEAKYDVGGARERVSNLRSLVGNLRSAVEAVDPSVTGRTSGTFTTEGQRQALVNRERQPILGDLSKQQGFLSESQADLSQSQALASQMASALFNEDQQTYQRLLDQYNAAKAAEQAAEEKRRFEEQLRLEREKLAAQQRATASARAWSPTSWTPSASQATRATVTNPIQQAAYNDVATRVNTQSDADLRSDYFATASSAKWGNQTDLWKLQIYRAMRPDLFKHKYQWESKYGF